MLILLHRRHNDLDQVGKVMTGHFRFGGLCVCICQTRTWRLPRKGRCRFFDYKSSLKFFSRAFTNVFFSSTVFVCLR